MTAQLVNLQQWRADHAPKPAPAVPAAVPATSPWLEAGRASMTLQRAVLATWCAWWLAAIFPREGRR